MARNAENIHDEVMKMKVFWIENIVWYLCQCAIRKYLLMLTAARDITDTTKERMLRNPVVVHPCVSVLKLPLARIAKDKDAAKPIFTDTKISAKHIFNTNMLNDVLSCLL